jgi:hypothetical protein
LTGGDDAGWPPGILVKQGADSGTVSLLLFRGFGMGKRRFL